MVEGSRGQGVWPVAQCGALIIGKVKNNPPAGVFVTLGMQQPMLLHWLIKFFGHNHLCLLYQNSCDGLLKQLPLSLLMQLPLLCTDPLLKFSSKFTCFHFLVTIICHSLLHCAFLLA